MWTAALAASFRIPNLDLYTLSLPPYNMPGNFFESDELVDGGYKVLSCLLPTGGLLYRP